MPLFVCNLHRQLMWMATELQFSAARLCTSQSMNYYVLVPRSDCVSWTCKRQVYCWSREMKTGVKWKPGFRSKVRSLRLLCYFREKITTDSELCRTVVLSANLLMAVYELHAQEWSRYAYRNCEGLPAAVFRSGIFCLPFSIKEFKD